jgi:hypothetical protein
VKETRSRMSKCKSCGQDIYWVLTTDDKWMPCDFGPLKAEQCRPGDKLVSVWGKVFTVGAAAVEGERTGRRPHWASCTRAKDFKKQPTQGELWAGK